MLLTMKPPARSSRGSALLEVLVTIVILAFGLLGVAGLQAFIYVLEFESYQRAQAVVILSDIADRVTSNRDAAAAYLAASPLGGSGGLVTCSSAAVIAAATALEADPSVPKSPALIAALSTATANFDACELGNQLRGSGERQVAVGVGAMNAAEACITAFTATTTAAFNRCQTGVQIDIVWRGRSPTIVPAATCGTTGGTPSYSATDAYRRAVSTRVATGDVAC